MKEIIEAQLKKYGLTPKHIFGQNLGLFSDAMNMNGKVKFIMLDIWWASVL